ncbi:uncharacterized protein LOC114579011 [Dendrobium catenatum]|uniref:uncharacterized protein LOC114579011 n=1 Tax=Dendrobium catenatum TaxID=906689 RepID=UPI00109F2A9D|nr:uncharacterized protein LOC114579011 [Dendrobium catenatum]
MASRRCKLGTEKSRKFVWIRLRRQSSGVSTETKGSGLSRAWRSNSREDRTRAPSSRFNDAKRANLRTQATRPFGAVAKNDYCSGILAGIRDGSSVTEIREIENRCTLNVACAELIKSCYP